MNYLLTFAILTLFTPFKVVTPFVQLRPFDLIAGAMFIATFVNKGVALPPRHRQIGLFVLVPFFIWHAISAFQVSFGNGLRETLQSGTILIFAWMVTLWMSAFDYRKIGRMLLAGLAAIMAYNVGWHLWNGWWTGWKRLLDPKATFTFLPLLLATLLTFIRKDASKYYWLIWVVVGALVLLSGERKALIVYLILSGTLLAHGRIFAALPIIAIGLSALMLFSAMADDNWYIARQLRAIFDPIDSGAYQTAIAGASPESLSNAQRSFAFFLSSQLISDRPLFGIGSNAYVALVSERFYYLPEYMLTGIHGEFLRVLTENGLIGLSLYLTILVVAIARFVRAVSFLVGKKALSKRQGTALPVILFVPCISYLAFEATGTRSFIVLVFLSLLPDFVRYALSQRVFQRYRRKNTESRRLQFIPRNKGM